MIDPWAMTKDELRDEVIILRKKLSELRKDLYAIQELAVLDHTRPPMREGTWTN